MAMTPDAHEIHEGGCLCRAVRYRVRGVAMHIWTDSAQQGVVLPAGVDCYRRARVNPDGSLEDAERFAAAVAAKRGG